MITDHIFRPNPYRTGRCFYLSSCDETADRHISAQVFRAKRTRERKRRGGV